jgi:hypothetical protein
VKPWRRLARLDWVPYLIGSVLQFARRTGPLGTTAQDRAHPLAARSLRFLIAFANEGEAGAEYVIVEVSYKDAVLWHLSRALPCHRLRRQRVCSD